MKARELTREEAEALVAFADRMPGRGWKTHLRYLWEAATPHQENASVYRLRNSHGPGWLAKTNIEVVRLGLSTGFYK